MTLGHVRAAWLGMVQSFDFLFDAETAAEEFGLIASLQPNMMVLKA